MSPRRRQTTALDVRPPPQRALGPAVVAALLLTLPARVEAYALKYAPTGAVVAWPTSEVPVHVFASTDGLSAEHRAILAAAIAGAVDAWSGLSGLTLVVDHGEAPTGVAMRAIVVRWDRERWATDREQLAITTLAFETDSGAIAGAVIRVNDAFGWAPLDGSSGALSAGYDLQGTLTHELGHAIGLAHSAVESATMHLGTLEGQDGKRTLDPDDVAGLRELYGPAGAASVAEAGQGCTDVSVVPAAHAGLAALLAALLLLGARRRVRAAAKARGARPPGQGAR